MKKIGIFLTILMLISSFVFGTEAIIKTNYGEMKLDLFEERAPITVANFVNLSENGFYDGIIFHRVIEDFMIQGGDPSGDGTGGPGYVIKDEFHPQLTHSKAGILSMANRGPNTGGSQFFITLTETSWLDGRHTVFGELIEGQDVLFEIGSVRTDALDKPVNPVIIESIKIKSPMNLGNTPVYIIIVFLIGAVVYLYMTRKPEKTQEESFVDYEQELAKEHVQKKKEDSKTSFEKFD